MASSLISNPTTTSTTDIRSRVMKKKKKSQTKHNQQQEQSQTKWKSQAQQQIYSSKLHKALARVNIGGSGDAPRRGRAVREAADRVLAVAARGRTRWSRAILTNRLKLKFRKQHKRQRVVGPTGSNSRSRKPRVSVFRLKGKTLPAVQRKVRVLGRLVPGCRKEPLPVILEEAIDYIPALEMQVRAMSALADLLFGSSGAGSSSGSSY
ncbi:transcription factor bHLH147-like [Gastrolobium bilobum]|uniref:transcription factor bHLH147-like n=1 Tax=Gastrolobium bilobum TaxID=150636 RepID=UPI002AB0D0B0|nr:transcription factor bHLH147-like [Gastrolobium bilobum]